VPQKRAGGKVVPTGASKQKDPTGGRESPKTSKVPKTVSKKKDPTGGRETAPKAQDPTPRPKGPRKPAAKAPQQDPVLATHSKVAPLDHVRNALGKTFTEQAIERVLRSPIRALGNVTPADAVAVGETAQVLAWANDLAEGVYD
jgi:hypothetical protein